MIIIPGPTSQILGIKVARLLNSPIVKVSFKDFPDGETYVRVEGELKNKEIVLIQSTYYPQDKHLIQMFFLLDTIKEMGPSKITLVVPYFAYARQDKRFKEGEALSFNIIRKIIENLGVDELLTIDIHAPHVLENFSIKTRDLTAMRLIGEYFSSRELHEPLVIAPDDGAIHRAKTVSEVLKSEYVSFDKFRDRDTGQITMEFKELNVMGRDILIVDDIISTGGTMAKAIKMTKDQGANKVFVAATHTLLIGEARTKIMSAGADEIIGTDTIPNEVSKISVAKLIADYLKK